MSDFSDSRFHTTCWTQVLSAKGDSTAAQTALVDLCDNYYKPVVSYLIRAGHDQDGHARDVAHDFFSELLKGEQMNHLDPEKGRFRSWLLGALKHFLGHRRARESAIKRGGGARLLSLDDLGRGREEELLIVDHNSLPPDAWFDRQWVMALLGRALASVEEDCRKEGKDDLFQHLSPWLYGEAEHGDQKRLADKTGLPINTLKSAIHRLRKKFRRAVKEEVARTLVDPEDVEIEMEALFAALRSGREK